MKINNRLRAKSAMRIGLHEARDRKGRGERSS
jgi:hypothetical protein